MQHWTGPEEHELPVMVVVAGGYGRESVRGFASRGGRLTEVTVTVVATSTTTGTGSIINLTTGQSISIAMNSTFNGTSYPICQEYADWVFEGTFGEVAAFTPITFTSPSTTLTNGTVLAPEPGGFVWNYNNTGITVSTTASPATIEIEYST